MRSRVAVLAVTYDSREKSNRPRPPPRYRETAASRFRALRLESRFNGRGINRAARVLFLSRGGKWARSLARSRGRASPTSASTRGERAVIAAHKARRARRHRRDVHIAAVNNARYAVRLTPLPLDAPRFRDDNSSPRTFIRAAAAGT